MKSIWILLSCGSILTSIVGMPAARAQTCSCATVPILGTMQSASPSERQWFLAATYEFRDISELVAGSDTIPNRTGRDRESQSVVLEVSRGLSDKWSVSGLLSVVEHERTIGGEQDRASGLGDGLLILKYSPVKISLYSKNTFSLAIGAQVPVGRDDVRSDDGLILAEDLQPSSGAYGGLLWAYYARALNESRGMQVYASASYAVNGENSREYKFGDSLTTTLGASYQTQTSWGFSLELIHRHASRDERNSVEIPNTGGKWLDVAPAVQYHLSEALAIKVSGRIPLSRDLNDSLQFSTKYAYGLSLLYLFGRS